MSCNLFEQALTRITQQTSTDTTLIKASKLQRYCAGRGVAAAAAAPAPLLPLPPAASASAAGELAAAAASPSPASIILATCSGCFCRHSCTCGEQGAAEGTGLESEVLGHASRQLPRHGGTMQAVLNTRRSTSSQWACQDSRLSQGLPGIP